MNDYVSREWLLKHLFFEVDKELVRKAPAADVEPVVRCKDCKFATPYTPDGVRHHALCGIFQLYMPEDWYCINGEMRDEGADDGD